MASHPKVLAAVSNKNIFAMLGTFLVGCARANISNAVVVALDDATAQFARGKGAHTYVRKLVARGGERAESRPRASADRDWSRLHP